ncbi:DUF4339 domain-containing protein [Pseudomonas corrugata]|uniref:DUF4339 domain-containing protein n=1 Tax=Pseudomonas corrugata TaxID=47879 RepID=A0A8B6UUP7_9PSED|nr:DUF4339 domain-containing protein [Pseudomonas corrugata]MDU9022149.1 DUF4339 domain-containing protein [Pseudomonas corrugata]QTH15624.1 DUF4339 domain-containing protein [Pseudomonas corrugata]UZD96782.1 DUF4339 domain-containing protein [Pseudomonas corrugata]
MSDAQWFYDDAGTRKGPVTTTAMQELVRLNKLRLDTLVWQAGMTDWGPLSETNLASGLAFPPPVRKESMLQLWAWLVAVFPGIWVLMVYTAPVDKIQTMGVIAILMWFCLIVLDVRMLRKAGYSKPSYMWAAPMLFGLFYVATFYLYLRHRVTKGARAPLVTSFLAMVALTYWILVN